MRLADLVARLPGRELTATPALEIADGRRTTRAARARARSSSRSAASSPTATSSWTPRARRAPSRSSPRTPPRGEGTWVRVPDARARARARSPPPCSATRRARSSSSASPARTARRRPRYLDRRGAARGRARRCGLVGTVEYRIGDRVAEAVRTTPESSDLQALFREMVDAGCRRAVLEVSSHSLALERVHGLEFKVAVFTNLTRDHLDFHGDMDAYFAAKRILFETPAAGGRPRRREPRRRPRRRSSPRASRGSVWTYSLDKPDGRPPRRGRAPLARRHALPRADADGRRSRSRRRSSAASTSRTCSPRSAPGSPSACRRTPSQRGIASLRGVPGRMEQRRRRARTSRCSSTTRTPTTRSRTCSRPCAG